ncbi:hypothetical protein [Laceyella tengchongensis]|nr:hypothetical protein [Laceyella tengchongensis]
MRKHPHRIQICPDCRQRITQQVEQRRLAGQTGSTLCHPADALSSQSPKD